MENILTDLLELGLMVGAVFFGYWLGNKKNPALEYDIKKLVDDFSGKVERASKNTQDEIDRLYKTIRIDHDTYCVDMDWRKSNVLPKNGVPVIMAFIYPYTSTYVYRIGYYCCHKGWQFYGEPDKALDPHYVNYWHLIPEIPKAE